MRLSFSREPDLHWSGNWGANLEPIFVAFDLIKKRKKKKRRMMDQTANLEN